MANQQAMGGNSMAAALGNMQPKTQRNPPMAGNFGAGLSPGMLTTNVWRGPPPGAPMGGATRPDQPSQAPPPPGGQGYPQMSPAAMQDAVAQLSKQQVPQQGMQAGGQMSNFPAGNMMQRIPRRPPLGNPAAGAGGGKNQTIAQLPGGPGR